MKAPKCRLCHHEHGHSEPHQWTDEPVVCAGCIERQDEILVLRAQVEELRKELRDVTQPVTPEVTAVTGAVTFTNDVTGVMHNKVTSSPERLAYLREYAKKRRAEAKA